jgi:hypothetical protein
MIPRQPLPIIHFNLYFYSIYEYFGSSCRQFAGRRIHKTTVKSANCQQLVDEFILYSLYLHNTLEMIALDLEKSVGGN